MNLLRRDTAARCQPCSSPAVRLSRVWFSWMRLLVCFLSVTQLSACGSVQNRLSPYSSSGVAVIGVSAKIGLKTDINRNALAADFTDLLVERGAFPVMPAVTARQYLGAERMSDMLNRYSRDGRLDPRDIKALMSAGLPTSRVVLARIEEDFVVQLPARREVVLNQAGELLADREKRVLTTQRVTRASATLIDLRDGAPVWNRQFRVSPVAEATTTRYLGSSFSGSLAAAFANTMVNGIGVARYPPAPALRISMISLLREIAENLPVR